MERRRRRRSDSLAFGKAVAERDALQAGRLAGVLQALIAEHEVRIWRAKDARTADRLLVEHEIFRVDGAHAANAGLPAIRLDLVHGFLAERLDDANHVA